jgi:hypothetical protein
MRVGHSSSVVDLNDQIKGNEAAVTNRSKKIPDQPKITKGADIAHAKVQPLQHARIA